MEYEIIQLEEKKAACLEARTNNQSPDMQSVIGSLWRRFYEEGIYASIPGKKNGKALGIYTDYSTDEKGDYTVAVGCEAEESSGLLNGLKMRTIPAGSYARFVIQGDVREAVSDFWQQLWNMDLNRAFTCDFEEYQDEEMEHASIHIYISLRG